MKPKTTNTARKAARFLRAEIGSERLTAGSLPNDAGMILAVRPPTADDGTTSSEDGRSSNGHSGNGNGHHPQTAADARELQALLVVADEELGTDPLLEYVLDGTPIGPSGEVVGQSTSAGILSWMQENKDSDGTLTDSYVISVAAELIGKYRDELTTHAGDDDTEEDARVGDLSPNGSHAKDGTPQPDGSPEQGPTEDSENQHPGTPQPTAPAAAGAQAADTEVPGPAPSEEHLSGEEEISTKDTSDADTSYADTSGDDQSFAVQPSNVERFEAEVYEAEISQKQTEQPGHQPRDEQGPHNKTSQADNTGHLTQPDEDAEEAGQYVLKQPDAPATTHATDPSETAEEFDGVGTALSDDEHGQHADHSGSNADADTHDTEAAANTEEAHSTDKVWDILEQESQQTNTAEDDSVLAATSETNDTATPAASEMDTTEMDASGVSGSESDTEELPTYTPEATEDESTSQPASEPSPDQQQDRLQRQEQPHPAPTRPEQTEPPGPLTNDNAEPHTQVDPATGETHGQPSSQDGSAQDVAEEDTASQQAAHSRFEQQLHEREPEARHTPHQPKEAAEDFVPESREYPQTDNHSTQGSAYDDTRRSGAETEDGTNWLKQMSAGRTQTPEQRAYMIQKEKVQKLSARLTFKRAPEPPPPLAPAHPLEGLAIERIAGSTVGPGIIVPMISKGGTGKTTMAIETAFKAATMTGDDGNDAPNPTARVLIIDMNLTNPDLASRIHITGSGVSGVKDLLAGEHISRVVHRTALPNLDVLFMLGMGDEDLDPLTEELSDPRAVQSLMSTIYTSGNYDIIVVDTANTLPGIDSNPASMVMTMWASVADARYLALEPEIAAFENASTFTKRLGEAIGFDHPVVPVLNSFPLKKVYEEASLPPEYDQKRRGAFAGVKYLQDSEMFPVVPGLTIKGEPLKTPLLIPSYPDEVKGFAAEGRPLSLYSESFAIAYRRIVLDAVCRMLDNRQRQ